VAQLQRLLCLFRQLFGLGTALVTFFRQLKYQLLPFLAADEGTLVDLVDRAEFKAF
jgi:hypothetical protein